MVFVSFINIVHNKYCFSDSKSDLQSSSVFLEVCGIERLQTAKMTYKVTKYDLCHSIGHIWFPISLPLQLCLYLAPFPRYYHLFPKM